MKNNFTHPTIGTLVSSRRTMHHAKGTVPQGTIGLVVNTRTNIKNVYGIKFYIDKIQKIIRCHHEELIFHSL